MMESKYGRLFTEADVRRITGDVLGAALVELAPLIRLGVQPLDPRMLAAADRAADQVSLEGLTFPADEPLFLLRGSWVAAAAVVLEFERVAVSHGWDPAVAAAANALSFEIARWQTEHPDRVKVPT